jgi:methionine-rich copper-binding protein CopC
MRKSIPILALAAAMLAPATPAFAHAKVVSSNPAANAVVAAPKQISVTFNEKVVPAFSKMEVSMPSMKMGIPVKTAFSADGKTMIATPQAKLTSGAYVIKWSAAAADDGHHTAGTIPFKIK